MKMKIKVINGPNLNLLGKRQPEIYGTLSEADLVKKIKDYAQKLGIKIDYCQSNYEGRIIDWIQADDYDALIINPAAYSHTSVAILDALLAVEKPKAEVHLSDINDREDFRKIQITSHGVDFLIIGKQFSGYLEAIDKIQQFNLSQNVVK